MTVDKFVAGLLKRYAGYDYTGSIPQEVFKNLVSKLSLFPISLSKMTKTIETQGYFIAYESLLVYDKGKQYSRLTLQPHADEQVITKLCFDPVSYDSILSACELKGYYSTGVVVEIKHGTYTGYCSFLLIAKDETTLCSLQKQYMNLIIEGE